MATNAVRFQDPGEGIHEGEVVEVSVSAGDEVKEGQVVLVVETDKADFDVESSRSGIVDEVRVAVGDVVEVGDTLFTVRSENGAAASEGDAEGRRAGRGEEAPSRRGAPEPRRAEAEEGAGAAGRSGASAEGSEESEEPEAAGAAGERDVGSERGGERGAADEASLEAPRARRDESAEEDRPAARPSRERDGPVPASPATRRLARDLGVDLSRVQPTGESGRVLAQDVRAHAARARQRSGASRRAEPAVQLPDFTRWGEVDRAPLRSVRRTVARRMAQAWESIPHVTHQDVADVTELEAFRRRQAARFASDGGDEDLTLTVLVLKAVTAVLREFPRFNASLDTERGEIVYKRYFHVGVAMDTDRGLLVPAIRDVDRKSVLELAHELRELAERARAGALSRDEMMRGTFTITNVGAIGGRTFTPIINAPQVAILGLGRARREPVIREEGERFEVVPRLVLPLSLAFDHRVNDGADAARFTNRLIGILGDPEWFAVTV
jgi:pyruvate dehydrogenase E2 component (dihydrolipoamide acetyltransferase)